MKRKASAVWKGNLQNGNGNISTESGVLSEAPYSFLTRFERGTGTNPEELVAAAHAACFSMALSVELGNPLTLQSIATTATVSFEKRDKGWTITESHLQVVGTVPGITPDAFEAAAQRAKANCPISRLLNLEISMDAQLAA